MQKSISNLIKELFDTESSLSVPTMLPYKMTSVHESNALNFFQLFLYITTEMGKRILQASSVGC